MLGDATTSGKVASRDLQHDGVDIEAGKCVVSYLGEISTVEQVEDTKVQKEGVVCLSRVGPTLFAPQVEDRLVSEPRIVGNRGRANMAGRRDAVVDQQLPARARPKLP